MRPDVQDTLFMNNVQTIDSEDRLETYGIRAGQHRQLTATKFSVLVTSFSEGPIIAAVNLVWSRSRFKENYRTMYLH